MKYYLTNCFAGFIIFDEDFALIDYELFQKENLQDRMNEMNKGDLTREEENILKRNAKKCDSLIIETNLAISKYKNIKGASKFEFKTSNDAGNYLRSNMVSVLEEVGFIESENELREILHNLSLEIVNYKLKEASKAEDMYLIQAINTIDEIDEATGKLIERIREWHMIHFPELIKIRSNEKYVELIAEYGDRNAIIESGLLEELKIKEGSIGADIGGEDLEILQNFANSLKSLQDTKNSLTDYVEGKMNEVAPNLSDLIGPSLGAKLIAHIGSIQKLSMLPSSTIQIMGAEKALFRHKKTGERPPKHGIIYQYPEIRGAKWWLKGKIARVLAGKIAIAVRKDFYSGDFDPNLKEQLQERLEELKKKYPFPPRPSRSKKGGKNDKSVKKKKKRDKYKKNIKDYY
ncbi:MAG: ATP-binding protein [Methanobacterium sp.]|uniref:NOP5/NOP56 family protein n=1 Tax=Methanobacterium sp. TaxID=2164 RepID=UPI003D64938E|nr:ATP-binding protein [Methanobacterium sp.]